MKLLFDMNLSPFLAKIINKEGFEAIHWSKVGDPGATDQFILNWALQNDITVITNDLDFGAIFAATKAQCPSVIQIRTQDLSPEHLKPILHTVLQEYGEYIETGALISVDERRARLRILPMRQGRGSEGNEE